MDTRGHNLPLGERVHSALLRAAEAESEAERLEKLAKRVFSQIVIGSEGSVAQREHAARCNAKYVVIEDQFITAQTAANVARAEADAMKLRFEEWRTQAATTRAEMNLR